MGVFGIVVWAVGLATGQVEGQRGAGQYGGDLLIEETQVRAEEKSIGLTEGEANSARYEVLRAGDGRPQAVEQMV